MAQYITIADCTKGKNYEFKSNGFKPEYFQFEPFVEFIKLQKGKER